MNEYLAIGCSHTRAKDLPGALRWTETIAPHIGQPFSYYNTCKIASGLINLQIRACNLFKGTSDQVKWLIIQKPQSLRFPWWLPDWENRVSPAFYDKPSNIDLVRGRNLSRKKFRILKHSEKIAVAKLIYDAEFNCLLKLRKMFSNAKIAYFHYWVDHTMDLLQWPELSEINGQLGEAIVSEGIENWNIIVDPHDIPGAYDSEGNILMDGVELAESGWAFSKRDLHPGPTYHNQVLEKVKNWVT